MRERETPAFPPAQHGAVRERAPPFQLQHHTHSPGEGPAFPPAAPHTALERARLAPQPQPGPAPRARVGRALRHPGRASAQSPEEAASGLRGLPLLVCLDASFLHRASAGMRSFHLKTGRAPPLGKGGSYKACPMCGVVGDGPAAVPCHPLPSCGTNTSLDGKEAMTVTGAQDHCRPWRPRTFTGRVA